MSRRITPSDLDDPVLMTELRTLAVEFFAESELPGVLDFEFFIEAWRKLLVSGMGVMFITEDKEELTGAIGAVITPNLFTGDVMASELFWYVREGYRGVSGIRLLKEMFAWANDLGVDDVMMGHLHFAVSEKAESIYDRLGMKKFETMYLGKPVWR